MTAPDSPAASAGPALRDRLARATTDLAAASSQLNQRANGVFRATAAQIRELVEARLEAFVLGQPDRTARLGPARVARLRSALEASLGGLPVASAKHLAGAFAWTFPRVPAEVGDRDRVPLFRGGADLPWMLDDVIREMVAEAGRLAVSAGYEIRPSSHWDVAPDGTVRRYSGPFQAAPALVIALRSYSDARLRYFRALRSVRRLEAALRAETARLEAEAEEESAVAPARWLWSAPAGDAQG